VLAGTDNIDRFQPDNAPGIESLLTGFTLVIIVGVVYADENKDLVV